MKADLKETNAEISTVTHDRSKIENPTNNIYEAISILAKRSSQINSEVKKELMDKINEFSTQNENLDEVFENKEQIEVSKYYERLPKPHAIAIEEWQNNKIYHRKTDQDDTDV
mgnify:FL=1